LWSCCRDPHSRFHSTTLDLRSTGRGIQEHHIKGSYAHTSPTTIQNTAGSYPHGPGCRRREVIGTNLQILLIALRAAHPVHIWACLLCGANTRCARAPCAVCVCSCVLCSPSVPRALTGPPGIPLPTNPRTANLVFESKNALIVPRTSGIWAPVQDTCSARSHLARPLPCVDRTIGERSLTTPRCLLAQLMELTTYCSDCTPAHAPCSAIYALHLSLHVLSLHGA